MAAAPSDAEKVTFPPTECPESLKAGRDRWDQQPLDIMTHMGVGPQTPGSLDDGAPESTPGFQGSVHKPLGRWAVPWSQLQWVSP